MSVATPSTTQPGESVDGYQSSHNRDGTGHRGKAQDPLQPLAATTSLAAPQSLPEEIMTLWQMGLPQGATLGGSLAQPAAGPVNSWQPAASAGPPVQPSAGFAGQAPATSIPATKPLQHTQEGSSTAGHSGSAAGGEQSALGHAYKKRGRPLGSKNRKTLEREALAAGLPLPSKEPAQVAGPKRRGRPPGSKTKKKQEVAAPGTAQLSPLSNLLPCFPVIVSAAQTDPAQPPQTSALNPGGTAAAPAGEGRPSGLAGASPAAVNGGLESEAGPQQGGGAVCGVELSSKEELLQKFGPDVLARYPQLLGQFKVPGRKPGRPPGSKTVNRNTKGEAKPPARPLQSGKRRGRPPGSLNKATLIKMGALPTPIVLSSNAAQPSAPSLAAAARLPSSSSPAVRPQVSASPAAVPVPKHSNGSGLADLVPKADLPSTSIAAVGNPVPAVTGLATSTVEEISTKAPTIMQLE